MSWSEGEQRAWGDLVGHIYDAALDDRLWAGLADLIAMAFAATSAVIKLHGANDVVQLLELTPNLVVPEHLQAWATSWHGHDLWVERSKAFGMSRVVTSQELVSEREQRSSGFYHEWLDYLCIHHMIGAVFPADGAAIGVLGIHRPVSAAAFAEQDRRRMAFLLPHLQRALQLGQQMAQTSLHRQVALETLDALDTGVLIVDQACRIVHANAVAEAMLHGGDGLLLHGNCVAAPNLTVQRCLETAVRGSVATAAGGLAPAANAIRIDRPGRAAITAAITPLRPHWPRLTWQHPLALILLRDPEYPPIVIDRLRDLFGLTRSESIIAAELARGRALPQIAESVGIGLATVRSHLKQILLKTGTNRQGEAIALVDRSIAAMRGAG